MEAIIDAIPDLMLEVGLDGIYNYHSHRKDSFTESTSVLVKAVHVKRTKTPDNSL
jgi:hypothetical protein